MISFSRRLLDVSGAGYGRNHAQFVWKLIKIVIYSRFRGLWTSPPSYAESNKNHVALYNNCCSTNISNTQSIASTAAATTTTATAATRTTYVKIYIYKHVYKRVYIQVYLYKYQSCTIAHTFSPIASTIFTSCKDLLTDQQLPLLLSPMRSSQGKVSMVSNTILPCSKECQAPGHESVVV